MSYDQKNQKTSDGEIHRNPNRIVSFLLHVLLPLVAIGCGVAITVYLMKTSPEAKTRKKAPSALLVEVQRTMVSTEQTRIFGMGEIIAARAIEIKPRVNGQIIKLNPEFLPGGYFKEGAPLVTIDPTDYTLLVQQYQSEVAKTESDLAIEMGNQLIAQKEFAMLDEPVNDTEKSLILRKPQLNKLKASHQVALSRLRQAKLDLKRTVVTTPFNAVVEERLIDQGARVSETTSLAKIVGTDSFWLRLTLPIEQLQWLKIPTSFEQHGSRVKIYSQSSTTNSQFRIGHILRLVPSLETEGRMAQLLIEIKDPLSLKDENLGKPKLLLGSYVHAEIEGVSLDSVFAVPRSHIHEGNTVWLMDKEGLLQIQPVTIAFKNRENVLITKGLSNNDRIITTPLGSPLAGTPLRLARTGKKKQFKRFNTDGSKKKLRKPETVQTPREMSRAY